jgi:hypothetical protein
MLKNNYFFDFFEKIFIPKYIPIIKICIIVKNIA